MNEILHANIFFVIASIATVCFTILICLVLYQVFKVVSAIRRIVDRVETGSQAVAADIEKLRTSFNPMNIISFVMSMMPGMQSQQQQKEDDE